MVGTTLVQTCYNVSVYLMATDCGAVSGEAPLTTLTLARQ